MQPALAPAPHPSMQSTAQVSISPLERVCHHIYIPRLILRDLGVHGNLPVFQDGLRGCGYTMTRRKLP
jgi:hypothetical protein